MEKNEKKKPAYMITSGNIVDPERMGEYLANAVPLFDKAGAVEVAFGHQSNNTINLLEGEWNVPGLVMAYKFPSMDAINKFWNSPEYQKVKDFRDDGVVDPNFTIAIEDRN
jgi:uncharacterized protein (DUF1330 family)